MESWRCPSLGHGGHPEAQSRGLIRRRPVEAGPDPSEGVDSLLVVAVVLSPGRGQVGRVPFRVA